MLLQCDDVTQHLTPHRVKILIKANFSGNLQFVGGLDELWIKTWV